MASILTVSIANNTYLIKDNSLSIGDAIDQPKACSFQIEDPAGNGAFFKGMPVTITDSVKGVLYTGYVDKPAAVNLYPNAYRQWQTACLDQTLLAMQRTSNSIYNTQPAAVILCDQLQNILADEGVTGAYALDYNHLQSDWTAGSAQLTGVVAATNTGNGNVGDGDLELAPAGSPLSYTDDFSTGTLANTHYSNGALSLASTHGIQLLGTAIQGNANPYVYYKIWNGSSAWASGDQLRYDVFISSTSPKQEAGVDIAFTDGTTLRDNSSNITDQNGIAPHPSNDLSGFATDQWYSRVFTLTPFAGKTVAYVSVALEGDSNGSYAAYFRKIRQTDSSGVQKTGFFTNSLQTSEIIGLSAYINVSLTSCTVYEMTGTRTAPPISLSSLNIPQTSLMSWVAPAISSSLTPTVASTNGTLPTVDIQTSIDNGATWQSCANYAPIPNLLAGMTVTGRNLLLKQVFTQIGPDPTLSPTLTGLALAIQPSYTATKTDVIQTEMTQADWNAGTTTHISANSDNTLTLNESSQNWNDGPLTGQTLFGSSGTFQELQAGQIYVACNAGATSDVRSRLDFAGTWTDFIAEVDIAIGTAIGNTTVGLVYRTTGWSNTQNTFAYKAWYTPGTINLGHGTNGGADSYTSIASVAVALSSGTIHRMRVVATGSSHQVYLDGVLYINATDATYGAAGYLGLAFYNNAADGHVHGGLFDNFGVTHFLTGTFTSVSQSLAAAGTYGNSLIAWQEAIDPTGTTSLTVQTSINGGSTYQVCTNGGTIPNLVPGQSLSGVSLLIQVLFVSPSANLTPILSGLTAWIIGQFNASGTRTNLPLASDTFARANVASGFGTATDTKTYTKVGTGTTDVNANEGQISATTGDVEMVLGTNTASDVDGTVKFAVSTTTMQAGMELRRIDNNNFYRLYATTTSLTLVQMASGVLLTLASVVLALSINTSYRMRFRIAGDGPILLYGRVWLDGVSEPVDWSQGVTYEQ